jgi:hypothetical protein
MGTRYQFCLLGTLPSHTLITGRVALNATDLVFAPHQQSPKAAALLQPVGATHRLCVARQASGSDDINQDSVVKSSHDVGSNVTKENAPPANICARVAIFSACWMGFAFLSETLPRAIPRHRH